jgi:hypothetical protein
MKRLLVAALVLVGLSAGCMAGLTPLQHNKVYTNQSVEFLESTHIYLTDLYEKSSAEEKAYLEEKVNPVFNDLKKSVNLYLLALDLWETTGQKHEGLDGLQATIQASITALFNLLYEMGVE